MPLRVGGQRWERPCLYCDRKILALGLCRMHWQRWYKRIPMEGPFRHATGWIDSHGYRWLSIDGVEVLEHRHLMEQHLGRKLSTDETIHHKNEIKTDNRLENLEVLWRPAHTRHHRRKALAKCA